MAEFIITCDEETASWVGNDVDSMRPIVRCMDCKHADEIMTRYAGMQYACIRFDDATVTPDGFCAWASKRKEGGE